MKVGTVCNCPMGGGWPGQPYHTGVPRSSLRLARAGHFVFTSLTRSRRVRPYVGLTWPRDWRLNLKSSKPRAGIFDSSLLLGTDAESAYNSAHLCNIRVCCEQPYLDERHSPCRRTIVVLYKGVTMSQVVRNLLIAALIATTVGLLSSTAVAQDNAAPDTAKPAPAEAPRAISDEDIQLLRKDIRAQRKQLIAANMPLTPAEAEKFWPVYEQYISELVSNNNKKYALIKQFVQTGGVLTDAEAGDSVKQWVNVDESVAALRQKYIPIFGKVLSAKNEALFYQLDRRVQLMIDLQLMALIPMIEP